MVSLTGAIEKVQVEVKDLGRSCPDQGLVYSRTEDLEDSTMVYTKIRDLASALGGSLHTHTAKNRGVDHGLTQDSFSHDKSHHSSRQCHPTIPTTPTIPTIPTTRNLNSHHLIGLSNQIHGQAQAIQPADFKNRVTE